MNAVKIVTELRKHNVVLRLMDGQLKLIGETRNLSEEFIRRIKDNKEELIAFLLESMDPFAFAPILPLAERPDYPASNAQKRIWVLSQFEGGAGAYNIIRSFYLRGVVEKGNLNKAFQLCIRRHESLRTLFREINGELRQVIAEELPFSVEYTDISGDDNIPGYLESAVKASSGWTFNLANGPLLRVRLFRLADQEHAMIFGAHHIISDGWSMGVLVKELMHFYGVYCRNEEPVSAPLKIQYKECASWLAQRMDGIKGQYARNFWKSQFTDDPEPLHLPTDFLRTDIQQFEGAIAKFYLDPGIYAEILGFCKELQVTPFIFFRTTLTILLAKFSGQDDITIGTPVSGRNHHDLEDQIGLFVNTLPLRMSVDPKDTFLELLKKVSRHSFKAFEFQDYPFDKIIEDLQVRRDSGRNPLFDVMMVLQNTAMSDELSGANDQYGFSLSLLDRYLYEEGRKEDQQFVAKLDLNFNFDKEPDDRFYLEIEYATRLFKKTSIDRLFDAYRFIMTQVLDHPGMTVGRIEIISPEEKHKILYSFNSPIGTIPEHSLSDLLHDPLSAYGDQPAIIIRNRSATNASDQPAINTRDRTLSYAQLKTHIENVAVFLSPILARVSPMSSPATTGGNAIVGLLMDRTEWVIISILGILKAGAAYLPVEPGYPASRIRYIIEDALPTLIIADDAGMTAIPPDYRGTVIHVNELKTFTAPSPVDPISQPDKREDRAYLIYTSGSTGAPKAVEICHRNTIAFLNWAKREFEHTPFDILYATTSYCFDLSIFEFFLPLLLGKTIRLLGSALEIPQYINADKNIMINTVPSVVTHLLDSGIAWDNVVALNMAGEPIPRRMKKIPDFSAMEVRNLYGPSEDTTYSTVYRFKEDGHKVIPIGTPVGYTQVYIMNESLNLLPVGVEGEIFISGQSVAKGYLRQPVVTAARFLNNPFIPGMPVYKTGDIGRWLPDGNLEFIGRSDDQVKVRGYRIELGEIQCVMEQHAQVGKAVVLIMPVNTEDQIVGYWVGQEDLTSRSLKEYLAEKIPAYMVPDFLCKLDKIPLNPNGKVDKKQLPPPVSASPRRAVLVPPVSRTEHRLVEIWKEVLRVEDLGITQNFFELGGHSLKAIKMRSLLAKEFEKELTLNEIFALPTIEKQALALDAKSTKIITPIKRTEEQRDYPVSFAQERLWVVTNFEEASKAYNMPAAFRIIGDPDLPKLRNAFKTVIDRYEILRTVFAAEDGVPVQVILPSESSKFLIEEIAIDHPLTAEEEVRLLQSKGETPFDLKKGPLLACSLITTGDRHLLYFNIHHIISDGWSITVLFKNFVKAYQQLLPAPSLQYRDFSAWQRTRLSNGELTQHHAHWKAQFSDAVPVLELPTDFYRPQIKTYDSAEFNFQFSLAASRKINQLARQSGCSLFMTLMACVNVLLKKYANQNDIVVGTPVAGRDHPQLQDQIGFFVNTLPIRTKIDGNHTFQSLLAQIREDVLQAFEYQDFPFEMLVEELDVKRDLSRSPIFDVMLVLQNLDGWNAKDMRYLAPGLELERIFIPARMSKYDLTFTFSETDLLHFSESENLNLQLEYNTSLFRHETIAQMVRHLSVLCEQVAEYPGTLVKDIRLLEQKEYDLLASRADRTAVLYEQGSTIVSLFQQAANKYPDKIALVGGESVFSYAELDRKSGQLAQHLIRTFKIGPEELVILHFDRSEWMLVAILAVLKAGAAYVPVDPSYPSTRIDYIIEDTGSHLALFDTAPSVTLSEKWEQLDFVDITILDYCGESALADIRPDHLAYVIYTSGTTGNPKGVLIQHNNVTRLLFNDENPYDFNSSDKWALFHSYCFDVSVWEMFGAFLYGGTLVLVSKETAQNSMALYDFIRNNKITVLNQTPTAFRSLVQNNQKRFLTEPADTVRYLILAGEALSPEILKEWHYAMPGCRNINMYGPTETTVYVTYKEITTAEIADNKSNIGLPLPTLSCYVLDLDLQQVPVGVVGELCVGGAGVARGYLNKPALTAERFVDSPLKGGGKLYRSGDYARILPSGDIEYIGRKDDQVKIRGHRIEIAEIQTAITRQTGIKDALVLAIKNANGELDLIAYFIPEEGFGDQGLRRSLQETLPAYMVPSYLIPLAAFPQNRNGKLDKAALPRPEDASRPQSAHVACRNDMDRQIVSIWEAVLGKKNIGIKDNFFDLGGHSLKATRVISRIHEVFNVRIDLKNLFIEPTVEHLSDYIETIQWMENKNEILAEGQGEMIL